MRKLLLLAALLLAPAFAQGQMVAVSGIIRDPLSQVYQNCRYSVTFVGQSSDPGPYLTSGSVFQTDYSGARCDSFGAFEIDLPANANIAPTPSQWRFDVCDQTGIYCFHDTLTIGPATIQDISASLQAAAATLPLMAMLPLAGTGLYIPTTNLPSGGVLGNCAFWTTGGTLGDAGAPCGSGGGGGGSIALKTNGVANGSQTVLNLQQGTNVTLVDNSTGTITVNAQSITGTGTQNQLIKSTTTGSNPTIGVSIVSDDGTNVDLKRAEQVFYTPKYNFTQSPGSPATISAGATTVLLTPCPEGVDGTNTALAPLLNHMWMRLGGTGTAETVKITATTCTSLAASGTVTFTAANSHSAGYTIASATSGAQEAINTAVLWALAAGSTNGKNLHIITPCSGNDTNAFQAWAPVYLHGNYIIFDGQHCTVFSQNHAQQGIVMGDPENEAQDFLNRVVGFRMMPNYTGTATLTNQILTATVPTCPTPTTCTATLTFTTTHDLAVGNWILVTGMLNDNHLAGLVKVTAATSNTVTYTPWSAVVNTTIYAGGVAVKAYVAIEDDLSQGGIIDDVTYRSIGAGASYWNYHIIANGDQSMKLLSYESEGAGHLRPGDTHWVGAAVYAPGPVNPNGAVGEFVNFNCSQQSTGNCIDWQAGDDLIVHGGITQGYAQFAVRTGHRRGGFGDTTISGLHFETGAVTNPFGLLGQAGIINQGASVSVSGTDNSAPFGAVPNYGTTGNGLLRWNYYVIPSVSTADPMCATQPGDVRCAASLGVGPVLWAGRAQVDNGGSPGSVTVTYPAIRGATHYALLRNTQTNTGDPPPAAPFGTGNFLVADNINPLTACTDTVCTVTDSVGVTPTSFAVPVYGFGSYIPSIDFWPGALVMSNILDAGPSAIPDRMSYRGPLSFTPMVTTVEFAGQGDINLTSNIQPSTGTATYNGSPFLFRGGGPFISNNSTASGTAQLMAPKAIAPGRSDGGAVVNYKGLLNFGWTQNLTKPYSLFTFEDANYQKTLATYGHRPKDDTGDMDLGLDQTGGLFLRSATSLSWYNATAADNSAWKVRFTSALASFKMDTSITGNLTISGTCTGCGGSLDASKNTQIPYVDSSQTNNIGYNVGFFFDKSTLTTSLPGPLANTSVGGYTNVVSYGTCPTSYGGASKSLLCYDAFGKLASGEMGAAAIEVIRHGEINTLTDFLPTASVITGFNADLIDGAHASSTPAAGVAAVTGSGPTLDPGFIPIGGSNDQNQASYTLQASDYGLLVSNAFSGATFTLPSSQPSSRWWVDLQNTNATNLTIARCGGCTINGAATNYSLAKGDIIHIVADTASATNYLGTLATKAGTNTTVSLSGQNRIISVNHGAPMTGQCQGTIGATTATAYVLYPWKKTNAITCIDSTVQETPVPVAGTFQNLAAIQGSPGATGTSCAVTLYTNNTQRAVTANLGISNSTTVVSDTTHTQHANQFDTYSIRVVTNQATDSCGDIRATIEFLPD